MADGWYNQIPTLLPRRFLNSNFGSTMPTQNEQDLGADAWYAHLLRLTAFPVDPDLAQEPTWWEELTGEELESSTKKKREKVYEGTYQNNGLQLLIDPLRIQWLQSSLVDLKDMGDEFPNIGKFPDASESFASLMRTWLEIAPPLKRLAFGATLLQPVENHESGYRRLDGYLPYLKLDPNTSDFSFKINRRRSSQSGIEALKVNRLTSWSLLKWEVNLNVSQGTSNQWSSEGGYACKVDLDINSDQSFEGNLPQNLLTALWDELADLAREIAAEGDKS